MASRKRASSEDLTLSRDTVVRPRTRLRTRIDRNKELFQWAQTDKVSESWSNWLGKVCDFKADEPTLAALEIGPGGHFFQLDSHKEFFEALDRAKQAGRTFGSSETTDNKIRKRMSESHEKLFRLGVRHWFINDRGDRREIVVVHSHAADSDQLKTLIMDVVENRVGIVLNRLILL
jgi:hypothetical protein